MADDRETVDLGIDLRPVRLGFGGEVFEFNADPSSADGFYELLGMADELKAFGSGNVDAEKAKRVAGQLRSMMADLLHEPERDRERWEKANYGILVLAKAVEVYVRQVTELPTQPSSQSG